MAIFPERISGEPGVTLQRDHVVPASYTTTMTMAEPESGRLVWRSSKMRSGDAQRTWFPEMVARLRAEWHEGMSIPAVIGLRDELDETLHRVRVARNIQTPVITCRRCGMTGHAEPRVSVRSLILALARFRIAPKARTRALEKDWAAYRKQHRLDIEGRAVGVPQSCPH